MTLLNTMLCIPFGLWVYLLVMSLLVCFDLDFNSVFVSSTKLQLLLCTDFPLSVGDCWSWRCLCWEDATIFAVISRELWLFSMISAMESLPASDITWTMFWGRADASFTVTDGLFWGACAFPACVGPSVLATNVKSRAAKCLSVTKELVFLSFRLSFYASCLCSNYKNSGSAW